MCAREEFAQRRAPEYDGGAIPIGHQKGEIGMPTGKPFEGQWADEITVGDEPRGDLTSIDAVGFERWVRGAGLVSHTPG